MMNSQTIARSAARTTSLVLADTCYERVASMITALLVVMGLCVFCMLVAWLEAPRVLREFVAASHLSGAGGVTHALPDESIQLDSPTWQDIASESDLPEPELSRQTDEAMAILGKLGQEFVERIDAITDDLDGGTKQIGTGVQPGPGFNDKFPREELAPIPPQERWHVRFRAGLSLNEYARQLDHFGIELAVRSAGAKAVVVRELSNARPVAVLIDKSERRDWILYVWAAGPLREADRQLLEKAGIAAEGEPTVQLYPPQAEALLLARERDFRGLPAAKIRRTVFEVVATDGGYDFKVVEQVEL